MPILTERTSKEIDQKLYSEDKKELNSRWWLVEKDRFHEHVFPVCEHILQNLTIRRKQNWFFANLYNDIGAPMTTNQSTNLYYSRIAMSGVGFTNTRMTLNVLQSVIDAAHAMIAKNKPKPLFITDGAKDYKTKLKGKRLTKYVEGVFEDANIYQIMQRVFKDACIYGTGTIKLLEKDNKISAEWVFIEEILVDDLEGFGGSSELPRQIHQRKYINRDVLIDQFPKFRKEISECTGVAGGLSTFSTVDIIPVIESWHLPSGPKAGDGKHTICCEFATLFQEEYKKDYYPILFFRWADQTSGFWGRGICHEIWKLQLELDVLLRMVQQSMRLVGGPVIAVESGSNIIEEHITNNKLAKVIEYAVTPPQFLTPPAVEPAVYEHIQYIEDRMYKIPGVSQAQATGTKDPTLKSAVAQREAVDEATGRFETIAQAYEQMFMKLARIIVDMSGDLDDPSIMVKDKRKANRLGFKDVKVDLEDCIIDVFPVSGLASTPEGRMDQLMDYAQAGYVSKEQVMDVVDIPDLDDMVSLEIAALRLTEEILSNIKENGKSGYVPPGPYIPYDMAFRMACLEVDRATLDGVEEEHIDLLRDWANACKEEKDKLDAQAQLAQQQLQQQQQNNAGTPAQVGAQPVAQQQTQPVQGQ